MFMLNGTSVLDTEILSLPGPHLIGRLDRFRNHDW
jgi:hypothetical protein